MGSAGQADLQRHYLPQRAGFSGPRAHLRADLHPAILRSFPMRTRWIVALLATSGALALPVQAQRMCSPTASNLQTAVGPGVYELAYSPSQQAVYAAVAGGFKDDAPPSSLVQLDAANLQEKSRLLLPYRAFGLALDNQAKRLYVGHSLQGRISVIDTQRN